VQVLLEVSIGLILTFAVMAVVVSSAMELASAAFRMRAHVLEQGIARMLDDQQVKPGGLFKWLGQRKPSGPAPCTTAVLQHPLIRALSSARAKDRPPSYIGAVTFATAFLGSSLTAVSLMTKFAADRSTLQARIDSLPAGGPHDTIVAAWARSENDPSKLVAALLDGGNEAAVAALLGPAGDIVNRITALENQGDPAAATLRGAWNAAGNDPTTFVRSLNHPALMTKATGGVDAVEGALQEIRDAHPHLGKSLTDLWERAGRDFTKFRHEIEDWFDREMDRVSGWYSRWTQWIMVGLALAVALRTQHFGGDDRSLAVA